jgi:hypothetical protein
MKQKIIVKVTVVTCKNGVNTSTTKHIPLGETLRFSEGEEIVCILFQEVKFVYSNREDITE